MGMNPSPLPEHPGPLQTNEDAAARERFARDWEHLCRVVRKRLHPLLRSLFDPEDIVQDAFCALCAKGIPAAPAATDSHPMALLLGIARHQLLALHRRFLDFPSRDLHRRLPLAAAFSQPASEPLPGLLAEHADIWAHFVNGLSAEEREVLLHLCNGDSIEKMLRSMELSEWTIRVIRQRLLAALCEMAVEMDLVVCAAEC